MSTKILREFSPPIPPIGARITLHYQQSSKTTQETTNVCLQTMFHKISYKTLTVKSLIEGVLLFNFQILKCPSIQIVLLYKQFPLNSIFPLNVLTRKS